MFRMDYDKNLQKTVLSTIAYFDLFDFPLTAHETWKYCIKRDEADIGYLEVLQALEDLIRTHNIETLFGFYFLPSRKEIVEKRRERYVLAESKFKKAKRIIAFLALIPHVRMIGVINTLSYSNARDESDIDIMIVTDLGSIWLVRFIAVSFLRSFNLRPTKDTRKNKICLNFLITSNALNLYTVSQKPKDLHFAHIITHLVPVYNDRSAYQNFITQNSWTKDIFPNLIPYMPAERRSVALGIFSRILKKFVELIISGPIKVLLEKIAYLIQSSIMPEILLKESKKSGNNVVLKDSLLKFHINDKRFFYNRLFEQMNDKLE